ncbi:MAG TPA: hypothetical protein VJ957_04885 [Longimicrobiales bacterium]|nr:hypothetical protein [Longimicrobiales bacterium]
MARTRTGLADMLFAGLIIGATAFFVALPGLSAPAYMETGPATGAQVLHHVAALPGAVMDAAADLDGMDVAATHVDRSRLEPSTARGTPRGASASPWRGAAGACMARFLERAGRLACPATAPPHPSA